LRSEPYTEAAGESDALVTDSLNNKIRSFIYAKEFLLNSEAGFVMGELLRSARNKYGNDSIDLISLLSKLR